MFDKLLHHKLLNEGLEGEGVITEQKVEGAKGQLGVMGFYVGVEGHIKFGDGTVATFSSKGLDTSKVGDLDVGTAAEWLEHHKAERIAAADAALAKGSKKHSAAG